MARGPDRPADFDPDARRGSVAATRPRGAIVTFAEWQARADSLGLKRRGNELVGPCPRCAGTDRFRVTPSGHAFCRQCCPDGRNPARLREIEAAAGFDPAPPPDRQEVTRHEYQNADGSRLVTVARTGSGKSKSIWREPTKVRKPKGGYPLYRLPSLLARSDLPVIVVEGEKTAEAGVHLFGDRYEIATSIGGKGAAENSDWSPVKGRAVTIWPDADQDGRKYAQDVAKLASSAGASDVRMVDIGRYGLPDGWDVADRAPDGFDIEQALSYSVSFSPSYRAEQKHKRSGRAWVTMAELLEGGEEVESWVVDDMLPTGGLSLLTAKPKAGKSTLGRCLALAIARGEPWLGRRVATGPVLYLALEEKRSAVRSHFKAMGATADDNVVSRFGAAPDDAMEALSAEVESLRPSLVIVDPLFRMVAINDGNDYAEVTRAMEPLLTLARETGTHVLATHHARKAGGESGDDVLGSSALFGAVDSLLTLRRANDGERTLSTVQRYGPDLAETVLVLDPGSMVISATGTKAEAAMRDAKAMVEELLSEKGQPLDNAALLEALEIGRAKLGKALAELVNEGRIARTGTGKRGDRHFYAMAS